MGNETVAGWVRHVWQQVQDSEAKGMQQQFFAADYVRHSTEADYTLDEFVTILRERREAFPDLVTTIEDVVVDGDRVAYRWSSVGHHQGVYLGVPPTGRRVKASGITISRIQKGKFAEDRASWNKVSVLRNLVSFPFFHHIAHRDHEPPAFPSACWKSTSFVLGASLTVTTNSG